MVYLWLALMCVCISHGTDASTTPGVPNIPTGAAFDKVVDGSFKNIDSNNDNFIERNEFDTLVIVADSDNNGCMTLTEYKNFSAGGPEIATRIYHHFDTAQNNCLTVDEISAEFDTMDKDKSGKVTKVEFKEYYQHLLQVLFAPVG